MKLIFLHTVGPTSEATTISAHPTPLKQVLRSHFQAASFLNMNSFPYASAARFKKTEAHL